MALKTANENPPMVCPIWVLTPAQTAGGRIMKMGKQTILLAPTEDGRTRPVFFETEDRANWFLGTGMARNDAPHAPQSINFPDLLDKLLESLERDGFDDLLFARRDGSISLPKIDAARNHIATKLLDNNPEIALPLWVLAYPDWSGESLRDNDQVFTSGASAHCDRVWLFESAGLAWTFRQQHVREKDQRFVPKMICDIEVFDEMLACFEEGGIRKLAISRLDGKCSQTAMIRTRFNVAMALAGAAKVGNVERDLLGILN